MNGKILTCVLTCALALLAVWPAGADEKTSPKSAVAPPPPVREFRGAWIATVANIDWPSKPGLPVAQQKAELIALLDHAADLHFNAVFFQVRALGDAFYPSSLEPWSEFITGRQGKAPEPFYDPLALAISEAHKRGLQLHVWFNPFRAGHIQAKSPSAPNHVSRTHPELVRHYGSQTVLDPGEPATQAQALAAVLDVVKRYDVDGVVVDDYFYPYPEKSASGQEMDFNDDASWKKYGAVSGLSRADWRRDNVNRFVLKLSQTIKSAKPQVQFGISPFGIWRPQNPAPVRGMDAYEKIYADARKWLANGWVDYFSPQLYWAIDSREQSFSALFDWWCAQNVKGRHVWPSLADYNTGGKFSPAEISRQVQLTRQKNDPGTVHYHLRNVTENPALLASVRALYARPALVPASPWIDTTPVPRPKLTVVAGQASAHIQWGNGAGEPAREWLLECLVNGNWTQEIFPPGRTDCYQDHAAPEAVSIRAVDRLGNLSAPVLWQNSK